jgi:two-component system, NarL family, sensor kinase
MPNAALTTQFGHFNALPMKLPTLAALLLPLALLAQTPAKRDSFLLLAKNAPTDTARVWALMYAGRLYSVQQPDTALVYIGQALALAEKIGFEPGIARCRINRSSALNNAGHYQEATADCQAAIPICERLGMKKELVAAYNNLGNAWDLLGNRWRAIDAFSKALRAMDGVNLPPHFPLAVRNNIARQYNDVRLFDKGFEYGQKSLAAATALGDSTEVAAALQIMAYASICLDRDAEAMAYCQRIARLSKGQDPSLYVFALHNMAVLTIDKSLAESERMAREALSVAREAGILSGEIGELFLLSRLSIYKKDFKNAKILALEALKKAQSEHLNDEVARLYLTLSDLALLEGDIPKYRALRESHQHMNDTLANKNLILATQELETKYETEKKEAQIASLEREREIQKLRLRQKNGLIGWLAGLSGLLFLAGFLTVRNLRHRRRLAEQAVKIQEQQITQLRQEQQISVADAVLRSQEDERSRLARDLHDGLGGMLSGVKQSLNGMKGNQILSDTGAAALGQVIGDLDRSIGELRHIARNMMPEALVRFGLKDALRDYCDHLRLTSGLSVHYQAFGLEKRLLQQTEVILFRIAQELLNNIVKHAEATQVLVQLIENDGRLNLTVEDNGKGFDPEKLRIAPGVGWLNIQSRVQYLGGTLDLRTQLGKGASVSIEVAI